MNQSVSKFLLLLRSESILILLLLLRPHFAIAELGPGVAPTAQNVSSALGQQLPDLSQSPTPQPQEESDRKSGADAAQILGLVGAGLAGLGCLFGIKAAMQTEDPKERAQQMSQALQQCSQAAQSAASAAENKKAKEAVNKADPAMAGLQSTPTQSATTTAQRDTAKGLSTPLPQFDATSVAGNDPNQQILNLPALKDLSQESADSLPKGLDIAAGKELQFRGIDSSKLPQTPETISQKSETSTPNGESTSQPSALTFSPPKGGAVEIKGESLQAAVGLLNGVIGGGRGIKAAAPGEESGGGASISAGEEAKDSAFEEMLSKLLGDHPENGEHSNDSQTAEIISLPKSPNGKNVNIFQYASFRFLIAGGKKLNSK